MVVFYYDDEYQTDLFVDEDNISISPLSLGFQFGIGFFTTLKYQNEKFYFIHRHIKRLKNSLEHYGYEFPDLDFLQILTKLMSLNNLEESRLKIIAFKGKNKKISVIVFCQKLEINKKPRKLKSKLFYASELNKFKSLNYFNHIHNHRIARKNGYDNFIYFDVHDNVLETPFANIFFANEKTIYTPPKSLNILPGIIRNEVISTDIIKNYEIKEKNISLYDLEKFKYCFLTNSIHGIFPVKKIDNVEFDIHKDWTKLDL